MDLVDEPAASVAPLLRKYHDSLNGLITSHQLWDFLETVPDANGNVHGCTEGSLGVHSERKRQGMKDTASALRRRQAASAP